MPANPDDLPDDERATALRLGALGRPTAADRDLDAPPPDLWDHISDEAFAPPGEMNAPADAPNGADAPGAGVVDLSERRNRRQMVGAKVGLAAAAAALVLIAGVAAVLVSRSSGTDTEVVAATDLDLLAGGGSGSAELVQTDDGLELVVDVSDLQPQADSDFFELWMLTPDASAMQTMGTFEATSGRVEVPVPASVDADEFPVVDISEELDDGDSTHSGKSILRGTLS